MMAITWSSAKGAEPPKTSCQCRTRRTNLQKRNADVEGQSRDPLVLIVEDDLGTRLLYRDHLTQCGFRTADAYNGHQALEKARELHPDVVVTDLAVPGIDGFEFCRALRRSSSMREIPILRSEERRVG